MNVKITNQSGKGVAVTIESTKTPPAFSPIKLLHGESRAILGDEGDSFKITEDAPAEASPQAPLSFSGGRTRSDD